MIQITSTNWSVYPIAENFLFFLQLVEVIWETTANWEETLTQSCAEKYEGFFALYRMKFDLVLRKLWMIWLVQEIHEPNHADHVIGQHVPGGLSKVKLYSLGMTSAFSIDLLESNSEFQLSIVNSRISKIRSAPFHLPESPVRFSFQFSFWAHIFQFGHS